MEEALKSWFHAPEFLFAKHSLLSLPWASVAPNAERLGANSSLLSPPLGGFIRAKGFLLSLPSESFALTTGCLGPGSGTAVAPLTPSVGFLVHRSWVHRVSVGKYGHRCGTIQVHLYCGLRCTCISAHLDCSSDYDYVNFERSQEALDALTPSSTNCLILIGIDANAVVGSSVQAGDYDGIRDNGREVGVSYIGDCTSGARNEAGERLLTWLRSRGLAISSTFKCKSETFLTRFPDEHEHFTHILPQQIDFIISDITTHCS